MSNRFAVSPSRSAARTARTACLSALLLLPWLSGCVIAPPAQNAGADKPETWQRRALRLSAVKDWTLRGRIAVHTERESWSADLYWRQDGERYTLYLVPPLGQGSVRIEGDAGVVTLRLASGETFLAPSAESLMQARLGWQVPLVGLTHWIRGLPGPGPAQSRRFDALGRLDQLRQLGWQVDFRHYTRVGEHDLPDKLYLETPRFRVRLAVVNWELPT